MDELKEIIRQLKKDVKEINQVQKESKCDIEELKRELIGAKLEQKIYKEDIEELKLENKNLLEKMSRMESTNTELKRRLETFDNESRNNKVVTSGIPIVTDDNLLPKHTASKMKSTNEFKYGLEKFGKEPQKNRVVMAEVPTDTEDTILKDIVGNIESAITKFIYRPEKLDKESKKIKVVMGRPVGFKETIIPKDAASKIESSNTELKHILETLDKETRQNSIVMTAPPIETDDSTLLKDAEGKTMKQHPKIDGSGNRPPYPSSHGAPYPTGPNAQPVFAPSLGFRVDAPLYMPPPSHPLYPSSQSSVGPPVVPARSQSTSPYPPSGSSPYPQSGSSPYPPSGSCPYPQSGSSPYPPSGSSPYPQSGSSPYPSSGSAPYPKSGSTPYPKSGSTSYPKSGSSPYPQSGSSPYPPSGSSAYTSAPTASVYPPSPSRTSNSGYRQSYPSQASSSPFPKLNRESNDSGTRQAHETYYNQNSTSYPNIPYTRPTQAINTNNYAGSGPAMHKGTPTVVPANPFNPRDDAEVLRKAMKGFGTDDKAIINVLSKRSNAQRLQISVEFKTLYGKDLIKDLKSETSGKFEDLIVALMTPLPQFYAKELRDAIVGLGTDEEVLIEVLCTKSNNEIKTIRHAYSSMYNKSLEDDLKGDTSGTFKRLMVSLCNACRDESMVTNQAQAAEDARTLLRAGELRFGTDESTFNMILCQRNFAQLRLIFEEYYKITGHDFEQAIKNEFSGSSKDGMLAIVRSIRNLPGFFAKCLQNAIAGLGTNDKTLIRVVATRCEIDMGNIKQNYLAQYGETLADAIKGDTSGDYKKLLLALIGES